MNPSPVDIPFLAEALSGERIWVILKVARPNVEGLVIATGGEGEEGEEGEKDNLMICLAIWVMSFTSKLKTNKY